MNTLRESVHRTAARVAFAVACSTLLAIGLGGSSARAQTADEQADAGGLQFLTLAAAYHGYGDGYARGAEDLAIGPDFRAQDAETFLRAEEGYTPDMGPLPGYQIAYRRAYVRGYDDAHSGLRRDEDMNVPAPLQPGASGIPAPRTSEVAGDVSLGPATANGYEAGYTQGSDDRRRGGSYAYRENDVYRAATSGYAPSLGDTARYQSIFRQIYARGYSDGFNGRVRYTEADLVLDETVPPAPRN